LHILDHTFLIITFLPIGVSTFSQFLKIIGEQG
jgi:hypothetical protein